MPRRPAKAMTATKAPARKAPAKAAAPAKAPAKKAPAKKAAAKAVPKAKKVPEAKRFARMGEVLDITDKKQAEQVLATFNAYQALAEDLERVRLAAFAEEEKLKETMQGYESLRVDGVVIATWKWANASEFDKAKAAADPMWPAVEGFMRKYTKTVVGKTRRFLAKGVAHVD